VLNVNPGEFFFLRTADDDVQILDQRLKAAAGMNQDDASCRQTGGDAVTDEPGHGLMVKGQHESAFPASPFQDFRIGSSGILDFIHRHQVDPWLRLSQGTHQRPRNIFVCQQPDHVPTRASRAATNLARND